MTEEQNHNENNEQREMTQLEAAGLSEEEFADQYVAKAQSEGLDVADAWVEEVLGAKPGPDLVQQVGPGVVQKLQEAGVIPKQVSPEDEGNSEDASAASEDASESATEATQEAQEDSETDGPEEAYQPGQANTDSESSE